MQKKKKKIVLLFHITATRRLIHFVSCKNGEMGKTKTSRRSERCKKTGKYRNVLFGMQVFNFIICEILFIFWGYLCVIKNIYTCKDVNNLNNSH